MGTRNLRIVSHNRADEAVITVPGTATGMGAEWLKTEIKGEVCRILSNEGTLTLVWPDYVTVDCVAIPAWNGSSGSEIRVRVFLTPSGGAPEFDSGWHFAAPGPMLLHYDFSRPLNVNNFAEGATVTAVWVPNIAARRVVIDLRDPNRTFLDISRLVVGAAFSMCGVSYGSSASLSDDTNVVRAASGDIRIDRGTKRRSIALNMNHIPPDKRHQIMRIINAGLGRRHFFSGYASGSDPSLEQELMMYGILTTVPTLTHVTYGSDSSQFQVEEM